MALLLRRRGIERVRPLAGGFRAWRERGYPMAIIKAKPGKAGALRTPGSSGDPFETPDEVNRA